MIWTTIGRPMALAGLFFLPLVRFQFIELLAPLSFFF
jgi:hypothetical protein